MVITGDLFKLVHLGTYRKNQYLTGSTYVFQTGGMHPTRLVSGFEGTFGAPRLISPYPVKVVKWSDMKTINNPLMMILSHEIPISQIESASYSVCLLQRIHK